MPQLALAGCFGGAGTPRSPRTQPAARVVGRRAWSAPGELPEAVTVTRSRETCVTGTGDLAQPDAKKHLVRNSAKRRAGGTQPRSNRHAFPSRLVFLEDNTVQLSRAIGFCTSGPSDPVSFFPEKIIICLQLLLMARGTTVWNKCHSLVMSLAGEKT